MYKIIGLVVTGILFVLIILITSCRFTESKLLSGIWLGSPAFCDAMELKAMVMKIDEGSLFSSERNGYIMMMNNNGVILNNVVTFKFKGGGSLNPFMSTCREYLIEINGLSEEEYEFFPAIQDLYYYPAIGKLVFVANNEVMAVVYRDNYATDRLEKMPKKTEKVENEEYDNEENEDYEDL